MEQNLLNADGAEDPLVAEFLKIREDLFAYDDEEEGATNGGQSAPGTGHSLNASPSTPTREKGDTAKKTTNSPHQRLKHRLHVETEQETGQGQDEVDDGTGITKHELLDKIEGANSELLAHKRDVNNYKRKLDSMHAKVSELQEIIDEKDEQIAYYERMATSEGLPTIRGNMTAAIK